MVEKEERPKRHRNIDKSGEESSAERATPHPHRSPSQNKGIDKKQMEHVRNAVSKRKKTGTRWEAKEEEKNYVEFRKLQVLYNCRPTAGIALRKGDDSFPRRRKGVNMGFGERKAYYLAIRPKPKYATWFGKKVVIKETKESKQPMVKALLNKKLPVAPTPPTLSTTGQLNIQADNDLMTAMADEECVHRGNTPANVLDESGQPFWKAELTDAEKEETEDDTVIVDLEILEKICDQSLTIKDPPFAKKNFDPFDKFENFLKDDPLFERQLNFSNTARTVMALIVGDKEKGAKKDISDEHKELVTWDSDMKVNKYDPEKGTATQPKWSTATQPLPDIVRSAPDKTPEKKKGRGEQEDE